MLTSLSSSLSYFADAITMARKPLTAENCEAIEDSLFKATNIVNMSAQRMKYNNPVNMGPYGKPLSELSIALLLVSFPKKTQEGYVYRYGKVFGKEYTIFGGLPVSEKTVQEAIVEHVSIAKNIYSKIIY